MTDITWHNTQMPDAVVNKFFEVGFAVTGEATAITNTTLASGSLPPGLFINADKMRITGKPTGAATGKTYFFSLTMTDTAGGVTSNSFSITVRSAADYAGADVPFSTLPVASQMAAMWPAQF